MIKSCLIATADTNDYRPQVYNFGKYQAGVSSQPCDAGKVINIMILT